MDPTRVVRVIAAEPGLWISELIRRIPGRTGILVRRIWMKHQLAALGKSAFFGMNTLVVCGENISIGHGFSMMQYSTLYACEGILEIGNGVSVNSNVCIDASDKGRVIIGNDVLIGPNAVLRASNHLFSGKDMPIIQQGHTGGSIVVEDDVWLGANVVVLPDVTVGTHSVVAASAVVTRDVEPWTVVGGGCPLV